MFPASSFGEEIPKQTIDLYTFNLNSLTGIQKCILTLEINFRDEEDFDMLSRFAIFATIRKTRNEKTLSARAKVKRHEKTINFSASFNDVIKDGDMVSIEIYLWDKLNSHNVVRLPTIHQKFTSGIALF